LLATADPQASAGGGLGNVNTVLLLSIAFGPPPTYPPRHRGLAVINLDF